MKAILALLAIAVVAASASQFILNDAALEKVKDISKGCVEKNQLDEDLVSKIRSDVVVDDNKAKNYYHCVFTEMNWVKGDSFHPEEFKKDLKQNLPFDVIEPCSRFKSTGPQLSYNINKCLTEHIAV